MASENKLLPCPFCGGSDLGVGGDYFTDGLSVYCRTCGACFESVDPVSEEEAIEKWNRRAVPSKEPPSSDSL